MLTGSTPVRDEQLTTRICPPGKYVFRVIARNSDGVWNTVGQSLPVVVLAPFYRTWQFLTFLALLGAISDMGYRKLPRSRSFSELKSRNTVSLNN